MRPILTDVQTPNRLHSGRQAASHVDSLSPFIYHQVKGKN
jgi:hypothetical protein